MPGGRHSVFLRHGALGGQELQTSGALTLTEHSLTRLAGRVVTSASGNERQFNYATRFEITFDAPVLRTITASR
jgi:hypothetical protein